MARVARGRIRTIKPELWDSEDVGALSLPARLLFIGLITRVDDEGRSRDSAAWFRGQLFPYDEHITTEDVEEWLKEIEKRGMCARYVSDGKRYLALTAWHEHQVVSHPTPSSIPAPPADVSPGQDTTPDSSGFLQNPPEDSSGFRPSRAPADLDLDLDQGSTPCDIFPPDPPSEPTRAPPVGGRAETTDDGFAEFWDTYPKRNGRRVGKPEALAQWRKLKPADRALIPDAVAHYAAERGGHDQTQPADAHRWLRDRSYVEWAEPPDELANGRDRRNLAARLAAIAAQPRSR